MPETDLVNWAPLQDITDGKWDDLSHLLRVYIRETQVDLDKLESAVIEGNKADVQRLAHGARGASGMYGITALVNPLQEIENLARKGSLKDVQPWMDETKRVFMEVQRLFEDFLKTHAPSDV